MRKALALGLTFLVTLSFAACHSTSSDTSYVPSKPVTIKNGYQVKGEGNITWFDLTPEEFTQQIDKKLATDGYSKLKKSTNFDGNLTYLDGDSCTIIITPCTASSLNDPSVGKIYKLEMNIRQENNDQAKMNGYYINTLIDMFNPGMASTVAKDLYIYDRPNGAKPVSKTSYGNVDYVYSVSGNGSELYIDPIDLPETSSNNISPINPDN